MPLGPFGPFENGREAQQELLEKLGARDTGHASGGGTFACSRMHCNYYFRPSPYLACVSAARWCPRWPRRALASLPSEDGALPCWSPRWGLRCDTARPGLGPASGRVVPGGVAPPLARTRAAAAGQLQPVPPAILYPLWGPGVEAPMRARRRGSTIRCIRRVSPSSLHRSSPPPSWTRPRNSPPPGEAPAVGRVGSQLAPEPGGWPTLACQALPPALYD